MAMNLSIKGLIEQFIGLWSSLRVMVLWLYKNWEPLIKGGMAHFLVEKDFMHFYFKIRKVEKIDILSSIVAFTFMEP
jgi:hypothetical protein